MLHDHPARTEEKAFEVLGGAECRCLQVLEAWRKRRKEDLPASLRPALKAAEERHQERRKAVAMSDPLLVPVEYRIARRITSLAKDCLEECSYRRSTSKWAGGDHTCTVDFIFDQSQKPSISGWADKVWSDNRKWSGNDSYITACIPLRWYSSVWKRGLAVVDGYFVLDVLGEDEKGIVVLAGKQGRGFDIYPCQARITTAKDGSRRLCWIKEVK